VYCVSETAQVEPKVDECKPLIPGAAGGGGGIAVDGYRGNDAG